ncbi:DUF3302 domain-containing protein [Allorhodopirellula solitaria]|uniref:DUF3302 domain-containing protein n=1 Tax=Allorhodopirellula solitaria TaxID=2527987 RepID=UPI0016492820|nr:DUF3302 domain-containing protein [Allorhodopirellula solitaria]
MPINHFAFESIGPTLNSIVLVFLIVFALILLGFVVFLAALPGRIAKARNHRQAASVNVLGWLGLPTGVLWAIALAWAYYRTEPVPPRANAAADLKSLSRQIAGLEETVRQLESIRHGDTP